MRYNTLVKTELNMKRLLMISALALYAHGAYAWTAQTSGSGPQAIGQDGGSATAQAQHQGQRQTQSQTSRSASRSSSTSNGGTSNVSVLGSGSGGGGTGGVFLTIPDGRGEAPCGGGIGLGGGGSNAGGGVGGTLWEFGDCKRMRESAALERLGYPDAALAELCQIDRVRDAFGGKCPTHTTVTDVDADRRDYCFTASAGELRQHKECHRVER